MSQYSSLLVDKELNVIYNSSNVPDVKIKHNHTTLMNNFEWSYYAEPIKDIKSDGDVHVSSSAIEQLSLTNGLTEYMYYQFTTNIPSNNCELIIYGYFQNAYLVYIEDKLVANTYHMLHNSFGNRIYTLNIKGYKGTHNVTILSEHFGLLNFYIPGQPLGHHGIVDIYFNIWKFSGTWTIRPYLTGEVKKVYTIDGSKTVEWKKDIENSPSTSWYQTKVIIPKINDNQVYMIDATGLNRGYLYINGHNLGRYWTIIGKNQDFPTQQYYMIPKDWININGENIITVSEVIGITDLSKVGIVYAENIPTNKHLRTNN